VIDTGERKIAFVAAGAGKFEPRRIQTGLRSGDGRLQVLGGLSPGERVVVSSQFLLDSESRLREATLKMLAPGKADASAAPMAMDSATSATTGTASARALRYVCPMPSHAGIYYDHPGDCPLCGMQLVPVAEPAAGAVDPIDHYTCPMPEHYSVHETGPGKCPLCGMTLIPVTKSEIDRFQAAANKPALQLYTCPMPSHADVVSDQPGKCPKCGMELVPIEAVPHGKLAEQHWNEEHGGK
jgi:rubrerythrin